LEGIDNGIAFPFAVFIIYGSHWGSLAYNQDPLHGISSAFEAEGGPTGAVYNSSQVFHNLTMCVSTSMESLGKRPRWQNVNRCMVSFIILIGTLRVNLLFVGLFLSLVFLFALIAAADATVPSVVAGTAELSHVLLLLKVAGGFGFVGMCCGW
jgi:succinate-acetate transporter protein